MNKRYKINYALSAFEYKEGQAILQPDQKLEIESETDDLSYVFKDLNDIHLMDNVAGLKILAIEPIA